MDELQEIVRQFSGKTIRVLDESNDFWIPIIDIANAMNYDVDRLRKVLSRNEEVFSRGMEGTVRVSTPGGVQSVRAVNEVGFY